MDESFPTMAEVTKAHMIRALREAKGDRALAAKMLGIGLATLYRRIQMLPLEEWKALRSSILMWGGSTDEPT